MLLAYKKRRERYAVAVTVTAWVGCVSYVVFLLLASLLYELHGEELPMPYLPFATAGTLALAIFCFFLYFRCNRIKARGERRFHEGEARLLRKWSACTPYMATLPKIIQVQVLHEVVGQVRLVGILAILTPGVYFLFGNITTNRFIFKTYLPFVTQLLHTPEGKGTWLEPMVAVMPFVVFAYALLHLVEVCFVPLFIKHSTRYHLKRHSE